MKIILLFFVMTVLGSFGAICFKKASGHLLKSKFFYLGGFLYFISAVLNIYLLKFLPYMVILPLTSITYIWTLIIANFILNEKITKEKVIGVIFIIFGVVLICIK